MQALQELSDQLAGTVQDVMTEQVHTAKRGSTVCEAADLMVDKNLRRVVVVDEKKRVLGVVSQRDVIRHYLTAAESEQQSETPPGTVEIEALITRSKPITVTPDVPLAKAALVLATNKIGCLPVVGPRQELLGVLSTTDLLRNITGRTQDLEAAFQFYAPSSATKTKLPAYIRKATGELVIPLVCLDNRDAVTNFALLGYDAPAGRILIKFVAEGNEANGALRTKRDDESLVIPASGFVSHFDLTRKKTTAYDVADHKETRYLILSPRQSV